MQSMTANVAPVKIEHDHASAVVEMEHLKKSFGNNHVLRDINLVINKGENLVILGKSGTGKSVLIKCIVGLIDPDEGTLVIFGQNVSELKEKELVELTLSSWGNQDPENRFSLNVSWG